MDDKITMNWLGLKQFWPQAKMLVKAVLLLLLLDIVISVAASFILSDSFYLKQYFSDKKINKGESVEKTLEDYFSGNHYVEPHEKVGWINTPNKNSSEWRTDAHGAQINPKISNAGDVEIKNSDSLVFLFGSSVINGYGVPFEQRPVGLLETYGYDVYDFSTALCSIDQSWALYESLITTYKPKAIVVGVHNDPEMISSMFVPFRSPDATSPYMKPAYTISPKGEVKKALPPVDSLQNKDYKKMLEVLEKEDAFYPSFKAYQRLSLLPFSDLIWRLMHKFENNFFNVDAYKQQMQLQQHFMQNFVETAQAHGTKVVFVKFESRYDLERPTYKRLIAEYLHTDKNALHNQFLKNTSLPILYSTEIFQADGQPIADYFINTDWVHFSVKGNALLAKAIHHEIDYTH